MLTKIGIAALLGTLGTAAVGGTASAHEMNRPLPVRVTIAAPAPIAYANDYPRPGVYYTRQYRERMERERMERMERERVERERFERERLERERFARMRFERERRAREHAEWLRHHQVGLRNW